MAPFVLVSEEIDRGWAELGAMLSRLLFACENHADHRESMFDLHPVWMKVKHAFAVVPLAFGR